MANGLSFQSDGTGASADTVDNGSDSGSIWTTLIENGGEILGGSASLVSALNGHSTATTTVNNTGAPAGSMLAAQNNTMWFMIIGAIAVLLVLVMVLKK